MPSQFGKQGTHANIWVSHLFIAIFVGFSKLPLSVKRSAPLMRSSSAASMSFLPSTRWGEVRSGSIANGEALSR